MRRNAGAKGVVLLAIGCAAALLLALFYRASASEPPDVGGAAIAEVNGDIVAAAELARFASAARASVIDKFMREYGAEIDGGFWSREFRGESPRERLLAAAFEEAVRMKVELQLARERGIVADVSYDALLREMAKENERRAAALARGEPIYGPARFEESAFVEFYRSKTAARLRAALAETELLPSEERLRAYYEEAGAALFPAEDRIRYERFSVDYGREALRSEARKREARRAASALETRLASGERAEEAAKAVDGARFEGEHSLDESSASRMFKSEHALYSALRSGADAEATTAVVDDPAEGRYTVVRIVGREAAKAPRFEEVREQVEMSFLEKAYEDYVDASVRSARVVKLVDFDTLRIEGTE